MTDFYCKEIVSRKTKVDIVYESDLALAFHHTNPYWEKHIVIIPKEHIEGLSSYIENDELDREFFKVLRLVTNQLQNSHGGCRVCTNVGNYQSTKHLHFYVHSGKRLRAENGDPIKQNS